MSMIFEKTREKYREAWAKYADEKKRFNKAKQRWDDIVRHRPEIRLMLIQPIAEALQKELPEYHVRSSGPFGLGNHYIISVDKTPPEDHDGNQHLGELLASVTFEPGHLAYETGELFILDYSRKERDYPPGSLGDINALGFGTNPLPETWEEFVEMIRAQIREAEEAFNATAKI